MPLVSMQGLMVSHVQMEWQIPDLRSLYERISAHRMLARYDGRGLGLSQRDVTNFSLDAHVLDLDAVVGRLKLERFALLGTVSMGPVAVAYAVRHPERVSRLVLWCTAARGSDLVNPAQSQALLSLADADWELFTQTLAHAVIGWSEDVQARQAAALMRESVTPQAWPELREMIGKFDVTDLLPQVRSPTLVAHRREVRHPGTAAARSLASRIPGARLVVLEGSSLIPYVGDTGAMLSTLDAFLGEGEAYPDRLTGREVQVLRLVAAGKLNREIAAELSISTNTVDRHVSNILAKTSAANRAEAAAYAARRGLAP